MSFALSNITGKIERRGDYYFLRSGMPFFKTWWYLYWYSRELFLLNERAKARKLRRMNPAKNWRMLSEVRKCKPKDFNRAQIFSFYVRAMKGFVRATEDYK